MSKRKVDELEGPVINAFDSIGAGKSLKIDLNETKAVLEDLVAKETPLFNDEKLLIDREILKHQNIVHELNNENVVIAKKTPYSQAPKTISQSSSETKNDSDYTAISSKPIIVIGAAENKRLELLYVAAQQKVSLSKKDPVAHRLEEIEPRTSSGANTARLPKKKVALLLSYSGAGYLGMQITPTAPSIELDLHKALALSGAVSADNQMSPNKVSFVRCARTDKGVHAAGQVVSLKMIITSDIIAKINKNLPQQIRCWGLVRTSNNFHAKNACDSRFYEYLLPTYTLTRCDSKLYPFSKVATDKGMTFKDAEREMFGVVEHPEVTLEMVQENKDFRLSKSKLADLRAILAKYKGLMFFNEGTHNFHNFTVQKSYFDNSANRYIIDCKAGEPFVRGGLEWVSCHVHGQSFMIHQIRKMIGLAIMMLRTETGLELMDKVFDNTKVFIPKAPGLGLLLEKPIFSQYNSNKNSLEEKIEFEQYSYQIGEFKEKWIYKELIEQESRDNHYFSWMRLVDSSPDNYGWFLNADGSIDLDRKPISTHNGGIKLGKGSGSDEEKDSADSGQPPPAARVRKRRKQDSCDEGDSSGDAWRRSASRTADARDPVCDASEGKGAQETACSLLGNHQQNSRREAPSGNGAGLQRTQKRSAAPKRVYPWPDAAFSVQTQGGGAARATRAVHSHQPGAQASVCTQECSLGNILGLQGIQQSRSRRSRAHFRVPLQSTSKELTQETDQGTRRNSLVMLINTRLSLAVEHYRAMASQITALDSQVQLAIIELIRKDGRNVDSDKASYIQTIISLLSASSAAVRFEAASTLVFLTSHASAVKSAATCYIELAVKESDNNVKMIVLQRIRELRKISNRVIDEMVMDVIVIVSCPDLHVRNSALELVLEMVSPQSVADVVAFLKKELAKTHGQEFEKNIEYRQTLIKSVHACAIRFPNVADSVVHILMEFLGDTNTSSAVDVIAFVREVMEKFVSLRPVIITRILDTFSQIKTARIFRGALWILGEYVDDIRMIEEAMKKIIASIGNIPIVQSEINAKDALEVAIASNDSNSDIKKSAAKRILGDGTYATESAFSTAPILADTDRRPPLRTLLMGGEFFVAAVLASCLTKLSMRYEKLSKDVSKSNSMKTHFILVLTSIIRLGKSQFVVNPMDEDSYRRIMTCLRILTQKSLTENIERAIMIEPRNSFHKFVMARELIHSKPLEVVHNKIEDVIPFRLLKGRSTTLADKFDADLMRATGTTRTEDQYVSKLDKIVQLTGFTDPVYAEAYVTVSQYDILLEIMIINQTPSTLQNLTIEFTTLGDLKLAEKPGLQTLGPRGYHSIKSNFKVSSTETGCIFGKIVYDCQTPGFNCVVLNEIRLDIMDYIKPSVCTNDEFRTMWTDFEWENKVIVNTAIGDLREYLKLFLENTNMNCLTPESAMKGECEFLAVNTYSKSIFGEDALANICIEKKNGKIEGHVRIRSKTQGIALSLGEKITSFQKTYRK